MEMVKVLALVCAVMLAAAMVPLAAVADTPTSTASATATATATATTTGSATATASVTRTATPTATPVADAAAFRDQLLVTAMANLAEADSRTFLGFFSAWVAQFPGLNGSGSAVNAGPGTVSVRWNYLNDKGTPGASNPQTITFAVSGNGRCEGAVIYGFPKPGTAAKVSLSTSACNADSIVASFRASFSAPTAVPTGPATTPTTAPKPPATGSAGPDPRTTSLFGAAGAVVACLGLASFALSKANRRG